MTYCLRCTHHVIFCFLNRQQKDHISTKPKQKTAGYMVAFGTLFLHADIYYHSKCCTNYSITALHYFYYVLPLGRLWLLHKQTNTSVTFVTSSEHQHLKLKSFLKGVNCISYNPWVFYHVYLT